MNWKKSIRCFISLMAIALILWPNSCGMMGEKIGVIFVVHGGMEIYKPQYMWDAAVQMFAFDPNHPVHKIIIWNSSQWGSVSESEFAVKFKRKYEFEYPRIGGTDPATSLSDKQLADMKAELDKNTYGINFEVEWAGWMCGEEPDHFPYPRYIYNPPPTTNGEDNVTYCGELEEDGPWDDCDPERYNVDGPVERLLKKEVSRIILVDLTVGGVRFSKTYDVVQMTKRVIDDWNEEQGEDFPYPLWINDYKNLMEESYPDEPKGWTATLGLPDHDREVALDGYPNPIAEDPDLAKLHVEAIEKAMSDTVSDAETGILILNHAINDNKEVFDPKMDDTLTINENVKSQLLALHPDMDPDNIIGARMGIKEVNPDAEHEDPERTREMRGEDLGHQYLYESEKEFPSNGGHPWGYLYWDALEYLKDREVEHIVIGFTQIVINSALDMVEIPNQIAKEIGFKTWAKWETKDFTIYPEVGHPFADYWGIWVDTECDGEPCSFTMGDDDYPPPRQAPLDMKRDDMDPSLAYDVSEYGHLGYDPTKGAPDPNGPVQGQYTGTWEMYYPPNDDPQAGTLLAKHVLNAALGKLK